MTGVRFYKSAANTGTHIGSLWSASGQLLAQATFTNETASGLAAGQLLHTRDDLRRTPPMWPPTSLRPATTPPRHTTSTPRPRPAGNVLNSPPLHAVSASAAPVDGAFASANGLCSYSPRAPSPPAATRGPTTGWTPCSCPPPPPPVRSRTSARRRASARRSVSWSAPSSGGPVTTYTITPYIGSEAQTGDDRDGHPTRDQRHDQRADQRHQLHLHRPASNPIGPARPPNPPTPSHRTTTCRPRRRRRRRRRARPRRRW